MSSDAKNRRSFPISHILTHHQTHHHHYYNREIEADVGDHVDLVAGIGEFIGTTLFLWFAFAGTAIANLGMADETVDMMSFAGAANNSGRLIYIALAFGISLMVNGMLILHKKLQSTLTNSSLGILQNLWWTLQPCSEY